ncbi:YdeI/OmpD-associated family protein [Cohnella phaseoli]|uniref:Uncharacterized protein DUF1905 n=1 Tax=Cohnella phaseoli TaxID=456490 RepID=A0A3D9IMP3_9BACL|nr:YdeI/OmpD-associated family protein [Cohnella phaseoli]RED62957.1 uncharacterized protein DUF1905 [Cohnella phaseoli]
MKFKTTIELAGKTATGLHVPDEVVASLGQGKKPAVRVTVGSHTYRTTVAVMGGRFMIPLSAENRTAAGVAAGDEVEVGIELDLEPREVEVPPDFADALAEEPDAHKAFEGLSYSNKRRIVLSIEEAKTEETRRKRIVKAIASLKENV